MRTVFVWSAAKSERLSATNMKMFSIALSAAWIVLAGYTVNEWAVRRAALLTNHEIDVCLSAHNEMPKPRGDTWTPCWEDFPQRFSRNVSSHWLMAGTAALLPVALMWLGGLIYSRRRQRGQ
jgi:hypothetical protein